MAQQGPLWVKVAVELAAKIQARSARGSVGSRHRDAENGIESPQNPVDFYERNRRILRVSQSGAGGKRTLVRQVVT